MRVPEARFEIVDAKVGQTNLNIDDIVIGIIQIPSGAFWDGQIIDITYLLIGKAGFNVNISSAHRRRGAPRPSIPYPCHDPKDG